MAFGPCDPRGLGEAGIVTVVPDVLGSLRLVTDRELDLRVDADVAFLLKEQVGLEPAAALHVAKADNQVLLSIVPFGSAWCRSGIAGFANSGAVEGIIVGGVGREGRDGGQFNTVILLPRLGSPTTGL